MAIFAQPPNKVQMPSHGVEQNALTMANAMQQLNNQKAAAAAQQRQVQMQNYLTQVRHKLAGDPDDKQAKAALLAAAPNDPYFAERRAQAAEQRAVGQDNRAAAQERVEAVGNLAASAQTQAQWEQGLLRMAQQGVIPMGTAQKLVPQFGDAQAFAKQARGAQNVETNERARITQQDTLANSAQSRAASRSAVGLAEQKAEQERQDRERGYRGPQGDAAANADALRRLADEQEAAGNMAGAEAMRARAAQFESIIPEQPGGQNIEFTGPDGTTFRMGPGTGSGGNALGKKANNDLEAAYLTAGEQVASLRDLQAAWRPEFSEIPTQVIEQGADFAERLFGEGAISEEGMRTAQEYWAWDIQTKKVLNDYIKAITGAAMSEAEAKRIEGAVPTAKMGPTRYRQAMETVIDMGTRATLRAKYAMVHGITSAELKSGKGPELGSNAVKGANGIYKKLFEVGEAYVNANFPNMSADLKAREMKRFLATTYGYTQ